MPIQSGWANNCGVELFTVGWVPCDQAVVEPPDCLPIIGQSWLADCPEQHYTLGWICCGIQVAAVNIGGRQFLAFKPVSDLLEHQIPVDESVFFYSQESDTEFVIDGVKYDLVAQQTPAEIIANFPNMEEILDEAAENMGVSRRKAKKELYNLIIDQLNASEELKRSIFNDDDEILMILVATDEI